MIMENLSIRQFQLCMKAARVMVKAGLAKPKELERTALYIYRLYYHKKSR